LKKQRKNRNIPQEKQGDVFVAGENADICAILTFAEYASGKWQIKD